MSTPTEKQAVNEAESEELRESVCCDHQFEFISEVADITAQGGIEYIILIGCTKCDEVEEYTSDKSYGDE